MYSAPGCVWTVTLTVGVAALKSSTILLKKLPSGPVNGFQTVSSTLLAGRLERALAAAGRALGARRALATGRPGSRRPSTDSRRPLRPRRRRLSCRCTRPRPAPSPRTSPAVAGANGFRTSRSLLRTAPRTAGDPSTASGRLVVADTTAQRRVLRAPLTRDACKARAMVDLRRPLARRSLHCARFTQVPRRGRPEEPRCPPDPCPAAPRVPPPCLAALAALLVALAGVAPVAAADTGTYTNPLELQIPGDGLVESCADPSVIQGQEDEGYWYLYCTMDPLNDEDRTDERLQLPHGPAAAVRATSSTGRTSARRSPSDPRGRPPTPGCGRPRSSTTPRPARTSSTSRSPTRRSRAAAPRSPPRPATARRGRGRGPRSRSSSRTRPTAARTIAAGCSTPRSSRCPRATSSTTARTSAASASGSCRPTSSTRIPATQTQRRDRQQVRGRRGRAPRRLVLPVRVRDRLLPRPADRVRGARRAVASTRPGRSSTGPAWTSTTTRRRPTRPTAVPAARR